MSKIRDSRKTQKHADTLGNMMQSWLISVDPIDVWPTCFTCNHLADDARTCKKFKAQPPVNIVVRGCEMYDDMEPISRLIDDDIPF